jgi:hypothetical protein
MDWVIEWRVWLIRLRGVCREEKKKNRELGDEDGAELIFERRREEGC